MDILSLDFVTDKLAELAAFEEKALETGATTYENITQANLLRFHIQSRMREFGMGLQEGLNSDSFYGYIRRAVDLLLLLVLEDTQQQEYGVVSPECLAWEYQRGFPMVSPDYRFDPRSKLKRRAPRGSQGQRPSKRRRVSPPSQQHHQQQQQPGTPPRRSPSPDLRVQWPSRCYGRRPPPRPYDKRPEVLFDQLLAAPAASTSAAATAAYTSGDDDSTSSDSTASTATASTATASTATASTVTASTATASTVTASTSAATSAAQPTYSPPGSLPRSPPDSPPPAAAARPLPPPPRRQLPPRAARQQAVAAIAALASPVAVRRRSRCGSCAACTTANCGHCKECMDMPFYGGPGRRKQCCISRRCSRLS